MTATAPVSTALALSIPQAARMLGVDRTTATRWLRAQGHSSACKGVCGHELIPGSGVGVFRVGRATRVGLYPLLDFLGAPRAEAS